MGSFTLHEMYFTILIVVVENSYVTNIDQFSSRFIFVFCYDDDMT